MISDYRIVTSFDRNEFEETVNNYLKKGYRLNGSVQVVPTSISSWSDSQWYFVQCMTLDDGEGTEEDRKAQANVESCWNCIHYANCPNTRKDIKFRCIWFDRNPSEQNG